MLFSIIAAVTAASSPVVVDVSTFSAATIDHSAVLADLDPTRSKCGPNPYGPNFPRAKCSSAKPSFSPVTLRVDEVPEKESLFDKVDSNGDGFISREEFEVFNDNRDIKMEMKMLDHMKKNIHLLDGAHHINKKV